MVSAADAAAKSPLDDDVSQMTSDVSTDAGPAAEWMDADEECAATTLGNLDIVLRILSEMCDGQYTDLQASN